MPDGIGENLICVENWQAKVRLSSILQEVAKRPVILNKALALPIVLCNMDSCVYTAGVFLRLLRFPDFNGIVKRTLHSAFLHLRWRSLIWLPHLPTFSALYLLECFATPLSCSISFSWVQLLPSVLNWSVDQEHNRMITQNCDQDHCLLLRLFTRHNFPNPYSKRYSSWQIIERNLINLDSSLANSNSSLIYEAEFIFQFTHFHLKNLWQKKLDDRSEAAVKDQAND